MKTKAVFYTTLALLAISVALALALGPGSRQAAAAAQPGGPSVAERLQDEFAEVSATVMPSVVNIDVARPMDMPQGYQFWQQGPGSAIPPELRQFFGLPEPGAPGGGGRGRPQRPQGEAPKAHGAGSGVVIDAANGYILTNNHVVEKATEIGATLIDGKRYEAKLVGTDPKTDMAVVQIKAPGLREIAWGDSDALKVGHMVLAFGQPDGLKFTVTQGIVSAKGRANLGIIQDQMGMSGYEDFIQTDAAINPGNSGGPLTNIRGELVGINTAIATHGLPQFGGIGFAVPSNLARKISQQLIANGEVVRGYLGVEIADIADRDRFPEKEKAAAAKFPDGTRGAFVVRAVPGQPADKAGIQAGDVVVNVDGKAIDSAKELRFMVADMVVGSKIAMQVLRSVDGKARTVDVTVEIAKQPESRAVAAAENGVIATDIGLTVQTVTPEVAGDLGLSRDAKGVVINEITPESRAAKADLQVGDVITQVRYKGKETAVESTDDFGGALSSIPENDSFSVLRTREGTAKLVRIE